MTHTVCYENETERNCLFHFLVETYMLESNSSSDTFKFVDESILQNYLLKIQLAIICLSIIKNEIFIE